LKRILSIAMLALPLLPLISTAWPGFAEPKNKSQSIPTAGVEAELKKLEREWFDAVVKGDAQTLDRILADGFAALYDDGSFIDKTQTTDRSVRLDEIKSDEFKLQLYGDTAVVTGRATFIRDQKPLRQRNYLAVWVRRAALSGVPRWQAVSWVSMPIKASVLGAKAVTTPSGLRYEDIVAGTGESPSPGKTVKVHYTGWLEDGSKFYSSFSRGDQPIGFPIGVGRMIKGLDEGVMTMKVGGKRKLVIPPELGYGAGGVGPIPPNSTLVYLVELRGVQ
jgi:peptidylprolyl isomerase